MANPYCGGPGVVETTPTVVIQSTLPVHHPAFDDDMTKLHGILPKSNNTTSTKYHMDKLETLYRCAMAARLPEDQKTLGVRKACGGWKKRSETGAFNLGWDVAYHTRGYVELSGINDKHNGAVQAAYIDAVYDLIISTEDGR